MGCGSCAAECPAKAITLRHYVESQILAAVYGLLRAEDRSAEPCLFEQVGVAPPRFHKGVATNSHESTRKAVESRQWTEDSG